MRSKRCVVCGRLIRNLKNVDLCYSKFVHTTCRDEWIELVKTKEERARNYQRDYRKRKKK